MYYVYILKCEKDKLYTGITTDYNRRFNEHKTGIKGAKFTKAFKPQKLVLLLECENRVIASKIEYEIKTFDKTKKLLLIKDKIYYKKCFTCYIDNINRIK